MAASPVRVVVHMAVKPEHIDDFIRDFTQKLIPPTRREPGCIEYDLAQDSTDPARFILIEAWESEEALSVHLAQPELQAAIAALRPMAAEPLRVHKLRSVPAPG
jgi:quinol monooxygenase YgiN